MPSSALRIAVVATFALAVVPLAHCSDDSLQATPSVGTIGPSGGAIASSDYVFEILVPAGALSEDVTFTITPLASPPSADPDGGAAAFTPAYTITASPATTFAIPAVFSFTEEAITGTSFNDPSDYRVAAFGTNEWVPLANPSVDTLAYTVEGTATVLSPNAYALVVPVGGSCVTVTEGCGADDDACAPSCAPAVPGKCAAYAGAVANACETADASTAISVECCYPTGQPVCFTQSEPDGCESPCSQLPGSSASSCVPAVGPPINDALNGLPQSTCCFAAGAPVCMLAHTTGGSCTDASPCAAYPGSSPTSCADVSDGTVTTCCLPVGTLPTVLPAGGAAEDAGTTTGGGDAGGAEAGPAPDAGTNGDASGGADTGTTGDASGGADTGTDSGEDAGD